MILKHWPRYNKTRFFCGHIKVKIGRTYPSATSFCPDCRGGEESEEREEGETQGEERETQGEEGARAPHPGQEGGALEGNGLKQK